MVQALSMAALTLSGVIEVWHILILSLLIGCINALDNPTRQAFYPSLVAKEHLSNAIALNSAVINGSRLIGPAVGGVLIGIFGEGLCFLLNGISYLGVIIALFLMHLSPFYRSAPPAKCAHRYTRRFLPMCPVTFPYGPCCC